MSKDLGWIRLYRSSFNNRLYFSEPFTRWQAWCDLLLLANHKSGMFRVRGIKVEVLRGQTGFSAVELADRWRWSRGKVNRFLVELKEEQQIVQQKNNVTTLISIVNYDKYQTDGTANGTQVGTLNGHKVVQQTVQQTDINKNDNNGKEDKKESNAPANLLKNSNLFRQPNIPNFEDVHRVFIQNGGTEEMAKTFFNSNESISWYRNGSPITNFSNLVPSYIENWKKNERNSSTKSKLGNKSGGFSILADALNKNGQ